MGLKLLLAAGAAISGLLVVVWLLWGVNADLRADMAIKDAQIERDAKTRLEYAEYVKNAEQDRAELNQLQREMSEMEGRDAPLSDHMRAAAIRLWP